MNSWLHIGHLVIEQPGEIGQPARQPSLSKSVPHSGHSAIRVMPGSLRRREGSR
ncbi:MAG TPA: hypothetical protein VFM36_08405 [Thermoanaerobaculia bacterium]|nr:hypothetical protein [Thermoanaerobaculia bacterium]